MELIKVDFKSHHIEVVEETQSIVVKDICEHIGLRFGTQYEKIREDESYESKLIKVQTNGGLQEVFTIPLSKLNGWLFSINPNKVKPEVKQKLIEYKKECFNVLNNYFNNGIAVNEKSSTIKTNVYQISGYKSQIAQHNKKIVQLENRIQELSTKNESLKIQNIKLYEEAKESTSFLNKIKNVLGIESLQLNPSEHNSMLEIIYQMMSFKNDLQEIENVCKSRKEALDNYLKVFTSKYSRCKDYVSSLENKNVGALQSKFRF